MKPESEETLKDEVEESPEVQKKEQEKGTEQHGEVVLPEDFQVAATALMEKCTSKECIEFLQKLIDEKGGEYGKEEEEIPMKSSVPKEFSSEEEPVD